MSALQLRHHPGEVSQGQHFDVLRERRQQCTESGLRIGGQAGYRSRQPAGDRGISERGAQPEQPQPCRRDPIRCEPVQVRRSLAGQDVAQQVVVDDERSHLRRGEVGILQISYELEMCFGSESPREDRLTLAGRKQDNSVAQVNDGHAAPVI